MTPLLDTRLALPFRNANYGIYAAGNAVSLIGTWMQRISVGWLTWQARQLPWIGLTLAVSFGIYGLLRKTASIDSLGGLTLETWLLLPLAVGYLAWLSVTGRGAWAAGAWSDRGLLVAAGPITAVPLLAFAAGARRIPLSLVGILQYLGPTLQLALGVLVFREPLPPSKLVGFALIWIALVVYTLEGVLVRPRAVIAEP